MLLDHHLSLDLFFFLGFYTFPHQCFLPLIPELLTVLSQLSYLFLHFYLCCLLWFSPMHFLTAVSHNLSIFSKVWTKLTHSWIVSKLGLGSQIVEPFGKTFTALFYFPIYIDLASSINTKFHITVVCMEGRNTSENDHICCFKAPLQYFVPRLPYLTKKLLKLLKWLLHISGYLFIGFLWLCTWYGERDWHTIITTEVVT